MNIKSRRNRGRYKQHKVTQLPDDMFSPDGVIHLQSAYIPQVGDPMDAEAWFAFVMGMDDRRYILTLTMSEARQLFEDLKDKIKEASVPRRVK